VRVAIPDDARTSVAQWDNRQSPYHFSSGPSKRLFQRKRECPQKGKKQGGRFLAEVKARRHFGTQENSAKNRSNLGNAAQKYPSWINLSAAKVNGVDQEKERS